MRLCGPRAAQDSVQYQSTFILQLWAVVWQTPTHSSQISNAFLLAIFSWFLTPFHQVKNGTSKCRGHANTESFETHFSKMLSDLDATRTINYASKKRERSASPESSRDEQKRAKTPRKAAPTVMKREEVFSLSSYIHFLICSDSGWWSHHSFAKRPWRELGSWWSSQTVASRGSSVVLIRSPESPLPFAELACACVRATERTWPLRLARLVDEVDVSQIIILPNNEFVKPTRIPYE